MSSQASRAGRLLAGLLTITSLGAGMAVRPAMGQEEPAGKAQGGRNDGKPTAAEKPAAPMAEAGVVDASVAALSVVPDSVNVDTGTQEKTEPAADTKPESAAS